MYMLQSRRARIVALLLAMAIILAACGDDASGGDNPGVEGQPAAAADHKHTHDMREWDGDAVPAISLTVEADSGTGWNVFADVSNFRFAPENASTAHRAGEGHAHVEVDGQKVARIYGGAYHLTEVGPGQHDVAFVLSANDHARYTADGTPLMATATITVPEPMTPGHSHSEPREWDGNEVSVAVDVLEDPKSGWNLTVDIDGYTLTPRAVGGDHVPAEGHLHVYVDGVKIGRLYGTALHLASLPAGDVEVAVRLSANDHREYTLEGRPLEAVTSVVVTAGEPVTAPDHIVHIEVAGGSVVGPGRYDVATGDVVELHVVSDVADVVHVHGADVTAAVDEGEAVTLRFVADVPGVWEVELEEAGTPLFEVVVS